MGHDGRADGIGSDAADDLQIGVVIFGDECSAREGVVVEQYDAVQRSPHAVDREPFGRGDVDRAESGPDDHPVGDAVFADGGRHGVEGRMVGAPEFGVLDDVLAEELRHGLCRDAVRMDEHPVRTVIERGDGGGFGDDEFGLAVDASVGVHVRGGGQHVVAPAVADHHEQGVVRSEADLVGDLEDEGRAAAAVGADVAAVDEDVGDALHAVEFHEEAFRGPLFGDIHAVQVIARCFEPVALGQRIGVPAVGQGYVAGVVGGALGLEVEAPAFVDGEYLPGADRERYSEHQQHKSYESFHGRTFRAPMD